MTVRRAAAYLRQSIRRDVDRVARPEGSWEQAAPPAYAHAELAGLTSIAPAAPAGSATVMPWDCI